MPDFTVDKKIYLTHSDDEFRYVIYTEDDPATITIEYQERSQPLDGGKYCVVNKVDGIWKDSAELIANAILELNKIL